MGRARTGSETRNGGRGKRSSERSGKQIGCNLSTTLAGFQAEDCQRVLLRRDAFRAGGIGEREAERFIRRMKQKIAEGLRLEGA